MVDARTHLHYSRDTNQNNYIYIPSLAGAVVACCLFSIIAILLSWQTRRYRIRYTIVLAVGAGCEALGYLFRSLSASGNRIDNFALFILMDMFVILSPLTFMAGLYVVYGRLVRRLTTSTPPASKVSSLSQSESLTNAAPNLTRFSPLPPHLYTKVFVTCDISSFLIQGGGAGLIVSTKATTAETGKDILLAGLAFGLISFCVFIFLTVWMTINVSRSMTRKEFESIGLTRDWTRLMIPIFIGELCILVRTIYRLIEFAGGYSGHIYTTEWYLYVFDCVFMLITAAVWVPFFPAKYGLDQSITGRRQDETLVEEDDIGMRNAEEMTATSEFSAKA